MDAIRAGAGVGGNGCAVELTFMGAIGANRRLVGGSGDGNSGRTWSESCLDEGRTISACGRGLSWALAGANDSSKAVIIVARSSGIEGSDGK